MQGFSHTFSIKQIHRAFTIAERTRTPPWGVTANICVRARDSRLRFDLRYPKHGGGEDLDFCARARKHGPIVSVPGARADHPWWSNGTLAAVNHILGWAEGEVLCVGKTHMQEHVFWTMPNGVEITFLLSLIVLPLQGVSIPYCIRSAFAILCCEVMWYAYRIPNHRLQHPVKDSAFQCIVVKLCAGVLIMLQDFMRLFQAIDHSPAWVFWRVDWQFGLMKDVIIDQKRHNALRSCFYCVFVVYLNGLYLN